MPSPCRGRRRLSFAVAALPLLLVAGFVAWLVPSAALESQTPEVAATSGVLRTPWTTSRVGGSPGPPPPFKGVRAVPNL